MTACRKAGGDCGDIQNKYAVISAEHRQKLHIDVATDPLTALSRKINGILRADSARQVGLAGCMVRWKTRT